MHATPSCFQEPVARFEERRELSFADRLQHLDRRELGVRAAMLSVVLFQDRDALREPGSSHPRARELGLFGRDRQTRHLRPVLTRGDEREGAPPAADLENSVVRGQLQLVADPAELPPLCLRERLVRMLEDGARVRHRLVEHEPEEVVSEVVVVADVASCAEEALTRVGSRPRVQDPGETWVALAGGTRVTQEKCDELRKIGCVPLAGRVRLTEA